MNRRYYPTIFLLVLGISEIHSYLPTNPVEVSSEFPESVREFHEDEMRYMVEQDFENARNYGDFFVALLDTFAMKNGGRVKRDRPPTREERNQRVYKAEYVATLGLWARREDDRERALADAAVAAFNANSPRYLIMGLNFDAAVRQFLIEFSALGAYLLQNPHHPH